MPQAAPYPTLDALCGMDVPSPHPSGSPPLPFCLLAAPHQPILPPSLVAPPPSYESLFILNTLQQIAEGVHSKTFVLKSGEGEGVPLDLSVRSPRVVPSPLPSPSRRMDVPSNSVRRSASSVSATPDVREHFRRSLSGKWPRRVNSFNEEKRSPFRRQPSIHNVNGGVVITTTPSESIEEHFRRALGVQEYEKWQRNRESAKN